MKKSLERIWYKDPSAVHLMEPYTLLWVCWWLGLLS